MLQLRLLPTGKVIVPAELHTLPFHKLPFLCYLFVGLARQQQSKLSKGQIFPNLANLSKESDHLAYSFKALCLSVLPIQLAVVAGLRALLLGEALAEIAHLHDSPALEPFVSVADHRQQRFRVEVLGLYSGEFIVEVEVHKH